MLVVKRIKAVSKLTLFLSILTFTFHATAQDRQLSPLEIKALERKIEGVIKDRKIPEESLFYHYLLAGRNLRKRGQFDLAIKYYRKGFALPVEYNVNRLKGMRELVLLLDEQKKYTELKSAVNELEKFSIKLGYLKKHPEFQLTIDFYRVMASQSITQKAIGRDYKYFQDTTFYPMIQDYEFRTRMSHSMFKEAYSMFTSHQQDISDYELRAAHDLLAIVLKESPAKWYCDQTLKEYSDSNAYSIRVCKLLEARKMGTLTKDKLEALITTAKDFNSGYFVPAIKSI